MGTLASCLAGQQATSCQMMTHTCFLAQLIPSVRGMSVSPASSEPHRAERPAR